MIMFEYCKEFYKKNKGLTWTLGLIFTPIIMMLVFGIFGAYFWLIDNVLALFFGTSPFVLFIAFISKVIIFVVSVTLIISRLTVGKWVWDE